MATDFIGTYVVFNGRAWTESTGTVASLTGRVSCVSASFCATNGEVWRGQAWTATPVLTGALGDYISCASPTFCAAPFRYPIGAGSLEVFDGSSWTEHQLYPGHTPVGDVPSPSGITCPTAVFCAVVGSLYGNIQPYINAVPTALVLADPNAVVNTGISSVSCPTIKMCMGVDGTSAVQWTTGNQVPATTRQPVGRTSVYGSRVSFATAATGSPAPAVQWQQSVNSGRSWTSIKGATSPTLTMAASTSLEVRATFSNAFGQSISAAANLVVWRAPKVVSQPVSRRVSSNATVHFTASASGTPTPREQWQRSTDQGRHWATVSAATSRTFTVRATHASSGTRYRAIFTNAAGHAYSRIATLTVKR